MSFFGSGTKPKLAKVGKRVGNGFFTKNPVNRVGFNRGEQQPQRVKPKIMAIVVCDKMRFDFFIVFV